MTLDRDATTTDALLTDLYLDALLAGVVLDAAAAGTPGVAEGALDPAARRAADRLRHDLVRVHPSFRFEERLATRLAEAAAAMRVQVAVGGAGRIVAFRPGSPIALDPDLFPSDAGPDAGAPTEDGPLGPSFAGEVGPTRRTTPRPLLIGGALTSAALSIAGAALVAWRLGRPGRASTPMARAARAVRDARLTSVVDSTITTVARARPRRLD
jgi:hypothetical protein